MGMLSLTLVCAGLAQVQAAPVAADWRYVVPEVGAPHRHPLPTALALGVERPEDLVGDFEFRGDFQRYGRLRYGDDDSLRVFVVLDHVSGTEVDLYVDSGRDFMIDEDDRVPPVKGADRRWETSLAVELVKEGGLTEHIPRRVLFELGATGSIFSHATLGHLEGVVLFGDGELRVERVDGDGNGFFTDARDQLWLDLDRDGRWSPFRELYLYAPTLIMGEERFALRSDRLGAGLSIDAVEGLGTIDLKLAPGESGAARKVTSLGVLLVGEDGSAVGLRAEGEPAEVPIGRYRVGMVTLRLADPDGGREWGFVFTERGGRDDVTWYDVGKGAAVTIDPIGTPRMEVGLTSRGALTRPGDVLSGSPRLYTTDGLLINTAYRGAAAPTWSAGMTAAVMLVAPDGRRLDTTDSGFA